MAHWMQRLAVDAGLKNAHVLDLPLNLPVQEAWTRTEETCEISADELASLVAESFHTRVADMSLAQATAARLLPASVAKRFHAFPVRDMDRSLEIATADPTTPGLEQEVAFAAGRTPELVVAPPPVIHGAIESAYSPEMATAALLERLEGDMADAHVGLAHEEEHEEVSEDEIVSGPVVRLTNLILAEAISRAASDVHIQPVERGGVVRFRTDGVLRNGL